MKKLILLIGYALVLAVGCSYSNGPTVSSTEYGDDWPLTIPEASLFCQRINYRLKMVWAEHEDVSYPLNGTAKAHLDRAKPTLNVRPLETIWRFDDRFAEIGARIPVYPLIQDGLKLCK